MMKRAIDDIVMETLEGSQKMLGDLRDCRILSDAAYKRVNDEAERFFKGLRDIARYQGEQYWQSFQELFGFAQDGDDRYIPINAANLCPEPVGLLKAVDLLRAEYNKNVAQQVRMGDGLRVVQLRKARQALAEGLGCEASELAILRNASEGNNAVSCGYRKWREPSDGEQVENVVLWSENHPTNKTAWFLRAEWEREDRRFDIRVVDDIDDTDSDDTIFEKFKSQIDSNTRFISYSDTSNGSGFRIPANVSRRIWEHVEELNLDCHVHVDGTMAWGAAEN